MNKTKCIPELLSLTAAIFALMTVSCKKEMPSFDGPQMPGLRAITAEQSADTWGAWTDKQSVLFFYSDQFPIISLEGSIMTIHSKPENSLLIYHADKDSTSKAVFLPQEWVTRVDSLKNAPHLNFPNCDIDKGAFFGFLYKLPSSECECEFYLEIKNTAKGLYYRTPTYRYSIFEYSGHKQYYSTSLTEIN